MYLLLMLQLEDREMPCPHQTCVPFAILVTIVCLGLKQVSFLLRELKGDWTEPSLSSGVSCITNIFFLTFLPVREDRRYPQELSM